MQQLTIPAAITLMLLTACQNGNVAGQQLDAPGRDSSVTSRSDVFFDEAVSAVWVARPTSTVTLTFDSILVLTDERLATIVESLTECEVSGPPSEASNLDGIATLSVPIRCP